MLARVSLAKKITALCLMVVLLIVLSFGLARFIKSADPAVSAITREGVVTEIQNLNRLTTVAFSVDTVITSQKEGSWYRLWQDRQKGLFVANGRVLAGVDLSKLTADDVVVTYSEQTDPKVAPDAHIVIYLPASELFEVYLDNIQTYDWQTGLFGMVNNDPEILNQAQIQGKKEVLRKACQGDVMKLAINNAKEHIEGLFALTGASVEVHSKGAGVCQL